MSHCQELKENIRMINPPPPSCPLWDLPGNHLPPASFPETMQAQIEQRKDKILFNAFTIFPI